MKTLLIVLALMWSNVSEASTREIGIGYAKINQDLFGTIAFPMDVVIISYSYTFDSGIGLRESYGASTWTDNAIANGVAYENRITRFFSHEIFYRKFIDDAFIEVSIGLTEYQATWKVNGVTPSWGHNTSDSDISHGIGIGYRLTDRFSVKIDYHRWYKKHKKGYGLETTRGFGVSFSYSF